MYRLRVLGPVLVVFLSTSLRAQENREVPELDSVDLGVEVDELALSADGRLLTTVAPTERVVIKLWDFESRKLRHELKGHSQDVSRLSFSPSGKLLASTTSSVGSHQEVAVWDTSSGVTKMLKKLPDDFIECLAFSADEKLLATGGFDKDVRIWDLSAGKQILLLEGHEDTVRGLAFSKNNKGVVSAGDDRTIRLWNIEAGEEIAKLPAVEKISAIALAPDGKLLAAAHALGISIWNLANKAKVGEVKIGAPGGRITQISFTRDQKWLVHICDREIGEISDVKQLRSLGQFYFSSASHDSMMLLPDGKRVGVPDRKIRFYDLGAIAASAPKEVSKDAVTTELKKLQGKWKVVSARVLGEDRKDVDRVLIFRDDEVTIIDDGEEQKSGKIEIDPSKNPAQIEFPSTVRDRLVIPMKAIYKLDGDTLTVCVGYDKFPADFGDSEDPLSLLMVLKRQ